MLIYVAACTAPARSTPVLPQGHEVDPTCLSIGAWNDLHGQISPDEPLVDTGVIPAGGVIALADAISDLRATKDTVVLLDAGDLFTGPLESTLAEGAPIIEAYRVIGVDAAAIGNHEFDFGPVGYDVMFAEPGAGDAAGERGPRGALLARMASASFPFLSANIHVANGASPGWPNFAASVHIHRGRFDVGVVGYTTQETPSSTLGPNVADLDFSTNAGVSVAAEIRALRASGASPVVLLAHASLEGALPQQLDESAGEGRHGELASLVASLGADRPDVIIAGHRHAWMLGRLDGIPLVSSDQHGIGLARIRFCRDRDRVGFRSIERVAVLAASPPRTSLGRDVDAVTARWVKAVKARGDERVATLRRDCPMQNVRGTSGAEQVALGMLGRVSDAAAAPKGVPVVAVMNAGAIRAPLRRGIVRYADLFNSFPFETTVAVCGTTRAGLARVLRNALRDPSAGRKFPFALAGAKATIELGQDQTPSLVGVAVDRNRAPTDDSPIWLAVPDFVLDGGDGFLDGVTCTVFARSSTRIRDAWLEIIAHGPEECGGPPNNLVILKTK
ncbi:MAG TPA: 5'-nucleotidase C-terminal domain-containing protein [Kofleriaceae bacterium]|nr:5'-nucleotidase C-terminal domain-containing protein [Kofleriaceae bacterium]